MQRGLVAVQNGRLCHLLDASLYVKRVRGPVQPVTIRNSFNKAEIMVQMMKVVLMKMIQTFMHW